MSGSAARRRILAAAVLGAIASLVGPPAHASTLTFDGVTYSLTDSLITATDEHFTLTISGINSSSDSEGGRYGVNSFAFTQPTGLTSGSSPDFTYVLGGLNASGCNMSGNFFCFVANTTPSGPSTLAPGTTLQYTFDLFTSAPGDFNNYAPTFKIEWLGTKNHYNLVSSPLSPSPVPVPAALPLLLSGIAGLGLLRRRRR